MPSGIYKHKPNQGFQKGNKFSKGTKYPNRYGKKAPNWQGGKIIDSQGYIYIWQPSHHRADKKGYIKRAVLVMEKKLKRPLKKEDIIHHKGIHFPLGSIKNKQDDSPENLKLFKNNSKHIKFHNQRRRKN